MERYIPTTLPAAATVALRRCAEHWSLSPAVTELMLALADGLTNSEIAACAGVSINTVKSEVRQLLRQSGISKSSQIRNGAVAASSLAKAGMDASEIHSFLSSYFKGLDTEA